MELYQTILVLGVLSFLLSERLGIKETKSQNLTFDEADRSQAITDALTDITEELEEDTGVPLED